MPLSPRYASRGPPAAQRPRSPRRPRCEPAPSAGDEALSEDWPSSLLSSDGSCPEWTPRGCSPQPRQAAAAPPPRAAPGRRTPQLPSVSLPGSARSEHTWDRPCARDREADLAAARADLAQRAGDLRRREKRVQRLERLVEGDKENLGYESDGKFSKAVFRTAPARYRQVAASLSPPRRLWGGQNAEPSQVLVTLPPGYVASPWADANEAWDISRVEKGPHNQLGKPFGAPDLAPGGADPDLYGKAERRVRRAELRLERQLRRRAEESAAAMWRHSVLLGTAAALGVLGLGALFAALLVRR